MERASVGSRRGRGRGDYHHHHQQQGRGRGRADGQNHLPHQQQGRGSSQGTVWGHLGTNRVGVHQSHAHGGAWGRVSFSQVLSQGSSDSTPRQVHDSVVPEITPLRISEHMPSSSSTPKNMERLVPVKRPDNGGTNAMRKINLRVNHFAIQFDPDSIIWHYDVDIKPNEASGEGKPVRTPKFFLWTIWSKLSSDDPKSFPLDMTTCDGEKNIFSAVELVAGKYDVKLWGASYHVGIKLVNELRLSGLVSYLTGETSSVPRPILQGVDLVMKENPKRNMANCNPELEVDLGLGVIARKEPRYSLKPTSQGLVLCLDYSVFPFRKPIPVIDYLKEVIAGFDINKFEEFKNEGTAVLKAVKVYPAHRSTKQKCVISGLTTKTTRDISFTITDPNGQFSPRNVFLVDYFMEKYGKNIMYKDIPCLALGKNSRKDDVPMEFCVLVEKQRCPKEYMNKDTECKLKRLTIVPPKDRQKTICNMVRAADGPCGGDIARNFGIKVDVEMTRVTGRVLRPPELKVGAPGGRVRKITLDNEKCEWNLTKKCVVEGKQIKRWVVLHFSYFERGSINRLIACCNEIGIRMEEPLFYERAANNRLKNLCMLQELLEKIRDRSYKEGKGPLQFILCVLSTDREDTSYKYLKWLCETRFGIATQCFLPPQKLNNAYLANLALSINAKLGGSNVELFGPLPFFEVRDRVMFVGADVNHPSPKDTSSPSIAAVVASMNWPAATRYAARIRPQDHRTERIQDFAEMCLELVESYRQLNKVKPDKLVIFRDGVSDKQFDMVLNEELVGLKRAFEASNYAPTITVVVAQKRHLTRFFPVEGGGLTGNVPPGTVVDTTANDFPGFNFFLCSHFGIKGTSKPTHYHVIWDEHRFTSDLIQQLVYSMCFTFAQCTKPVSIVPPVYYADLAAYRGRLFQEALMDWQPSSQSPALAFDKDFYKIHSDLENTMFFI